MVLGLISVAILYFLTAVELLKSLETVISKHPLFIYSVIVSGALVLSLRMAEKVKTIMLWFVVFFLLMYYLAIKV